MSFSKFNEKVCRICLGDKNLFNWNKEIFEFCGLTYKDCYYNYVQLDENNLNFCHNHLCEMCGNELRNAHFLFERALESFYILRNCINSKTLLSDYSDVKVCNNMCVRISQPSVEFSEHFDTAETETHINNSSYDSEISSKAENQLNNDYQDIVISSAEEIDFDRFENIQKLELSPAVLSKDGLHQITDDELTQSLPYKSKDNTSNQNISLTLNVEDNSKLLKPTACEKFEEAFVKFQPVSENSLDQNLSEEYEPNNDRPIKTRKKYILICQYCSLEVNGTNQLKKHEATHSENRERTHTCSKCGVKLYTQTGLNEHMKIHEENRQKNHKCEFCEKAFYNKGALNVHRRIHLGLMLKCQICSKEFFRQIDLDRHLTTHSVSPLKNNVKPKQYVVQCQYCNKKILTRKLREHTAIHTNQPQMKCKICDKHFYNRTKCVNHLRRFHRKQKSEYDDFIHNFANGNARISLLRIKQGGNVQAITK